MMEPLTGLLRIISGRRSEMKALRHDEKVQSDNPENEKSRRVYYQDIVYAVCNIIDRHRGGTVVCGSWESPCTAVQEAVQEMREEIERLQHQIAVCHDSLNEKPAENE